MPFDRSKLTPMLSRPGAALVAGLVLAVVLMALPASWTAARKGNVAAMLRPGHVVVLGLRAQVESIVARAANHLDTARKLAEAHREQARLAAENRRLTAELAAEQRRSASAEPDDAERSSRLLHARWVDARVLGQFARAFLARRHLLDAGSEHGVQADAPVIDRGRDAGVEAGQVVVGEGRVWGKVTEVGRLTSVVRTLTEPGYRDLVQLGPSGPEGILEGNGEPLARLRHVEVTEPVALGDAVYSAAGRGLLEEALLCGKVVRVERPVGAAHWEIWVEPAVDPARVSSVAVLRAAPDPVRVAAREMKDEG